jgi:hypothetical protein
MTAPRKPPSFRPVKGRTKPLPAPDVTHVD